MNKFCPTNDFKLGESTGKCWGCSHYKCNECAYLRSDFKGDKGYKKRDSLLSGQSGIQIITL
jgi:hypothetical protein